MNRRNFLISLGVGTMTATGFLHSLLKNETEASLPSFFLGHGSPMNALADNPFTQTFHKIGLEIPVPQAVLCISAHWETQGTQVNTALRPKQIFDFGGFPDELYKLKYEPPGAPEKASELMALNSQITGTQDWGVDHGTWTVLRHMYPSPSIPVFQLSLNKNYSPKQHFELAQSIKALRQKGVLIIASGNIVHNLRRIEWEADAPAYSWASEYENLILSTLEDQSMASEEKLNKIFTSKLMNICHPTIEHLLPLVYCLGIAEDKAAPQVLIKGIQNGSISMASVRF